MRFAFASISFCFTSVTDAWGSLFLGFFSPVTFVVEGMYGISGGGVHVPGGCCQRRISLKASNLVMLAAIMVLVVLAEADVLKVERCSNQW